MNNDLHNIYFLSSFDVKLVLTNQDIDRHALTSKTNLKQQILFLEGPNSRYITHRDDLNPSPINNINLNWLIQILDADRFRIGFKVK